MQQAKTQAQTKAREMWVQRQADKVALRESNQNVRAKRTPQQQLALLDKRLGKGQGAQKERAKLEARILIDEQLEPPNKKESK